MVHETKLLTFWRELNARLLARGVKVVDLDVAQTMCDVGCGVEEAADLLAPPVRGENMAPIGWQSQLTEWF